MDIKPHSDIKKLLDDLNARKQFVLKRGGPLKRAGAEPKRDGLIASSKLARRDLDGRGGPM